MTSIQLTNYKGEDWELKNIGFDEWTVRFCYSTLLSYHLLNISRMKRRQLISELGKHTFQIKLPAKKGSFEFLWIKYDERFDRFEFVR